MAYQFNNPLTAQSPPYHHYSILSREEEIYQAVLTL